MGQINERMRKLADRVDGISELARVTGLKLPTLKQVCNKFTEPRYSLLERVLKSQPEISAEWLMRGEGEVTRSMDKERLIESLERENRLLNESVEAMRKEVEAKNEQINQLFELLGRVAKATIYYNDELCK